MLRILRFFITTCLLIGVLSLTVDNRPIFLYVYKYSKKVVEPFQESTHQLIRKGYHRTVHFSRQFFNNNLPTSDSLEYQLSGPERGEDDYSISDRRKLDHLLEN